MRHLAARERGATAELVAHLAELQERKLYLAAGYSSMFAYCHEALSLTDHEAYNRIEAARAARRFPIILELLSGGSVSLTTVRLLAPHLTPGNHAQVLESARGLRKFQVEELVARLAPKPDVPASVRKLPAPKTETVSVSVAAPPDASAPLTAPAATGAVASSPLVAAPAVSAPAIAPRADIRPLSPDRYKLQLTIGGATLEKLRHLKDLLRHSHPSGDEAAIIDGALTLMLAHVMKKKLGVTDRPAPAKTAPTPPDAPPEAPSENGARDSHRVRQKAPAAVRRAVTVRDDSRCNFVSADGRRCSERAFLEFHHVKAWVMGGEETVDNLELRCRQHNVYEWKLESSELRRLEEQWLRQQYAAAAAPTRSGTSRQAPKVDSFRNGLSGGNRLIVSRTG